jgi:hypothetical protein
MDEDAFFENIEQTDGFVMGHIVFNLVADDRLEKTFSIEKLIELLSTTSLTPQN